MNFGSSVNCTDKTYGKLLQQIEEHHCVEGEVEGAVADDDGPYGGGGDDVEPRGLC